MTGCSVWPRSTRSGCSREASEDIARDLERRITAEGHEISLNDFVESQLGRSGVQLAFRSSPKAPGSPTRL